MVLRVGNDVRYVLKGLRDDARPKIEDCIALLGAGHYGSRRRCPCLNSPYLVLCNRYKNYDLHKRPFIVILHEVAGLRKQSDSVRSG
ncbi:MAG: hypothetical protein ACKVOL_11785 [Novosphingobium sp.]